VEQMGRRESRVLVAEVGDGDWGSTDQAEAAGWQTHKGGLRS